MSDNQSSNTPIKFDKSFTQEIDTYIELSKKNKENPTVAGFAKHIGVDEQTVIAWSNKKRKDENGNLTEELARPNFFNALKKIQTNQKQNPKTKPTDKQKKETKPDKTEDKKEEEPKKLNPKQELFCQLYATERDFFGNGTDAYAEAYDIDKSKPNWYKVAAQSAYRLLINVDILKRIDELMELGPLNDTTVDRQLAFVVEQNADFGAKVAAIREYNKLKQRITDKLDHTSKGEKIDFKLVTYKEENE